MPQMHQRPQVPPGTAAGSYYIIAKADGDAVVAETSETNNTKYSGAVKIGPDLVIYSLTAPSLAAAGASISVTDTTRNSGGGEAGASSTGFYLSTNSTLDAADVLLGSRPVDILAPGSSSQISTPITIPAGTLPGTYYIIVKADADNAVSETSETNNTSYRTITISQ